MRLTTVILIASLMQVNASGLAQKISLSRSNVPLKSIFAEIKSQSGYNFIYGDEVLKNSTPVTIHVKGSELNEVLRKIFANQPFTYQLNSKTIIVMEKMPSFLDRTISVFSSIDIRGTVLDQRGKPLLGATVSVKGTGKEVITNANGEFLLNDISENSILQVSFIGYRTKEVTVGQLRNITVKMEVDSSELEEVAVVHTGYQVLKKSQLTGAYATINRDTYLNAVPATGNIIENMEGKLAGLVLSTNRSRGTENESEFNIRGVSTFQAIKRPLIVLDGFPSEIDIASLNPYDIESITVLKDAASAAIYGVRASNGVVIVTTRKGKIGKPVFHFITAFTAKPKPNYGKLGLLTGREYIDYSHAVNIHDIVENGSSLDYYNSINAAYLPLLKISDDLYNSKISQAEADQLFNQLASYDNTEDYKKLFLQNPFLQSYDLSVRGGNESSSQFLGINRQGNSGLQRYSGDTRTNVRYNGTYQFLERFRLDVQGLYSNLMEKSVPIPDYQSFEPYQRFLDEAGHPLPTYLGPPTFDFFGFGGRYGTVNAARNSENMKLGLYDLNYYPYQEMFESSTRIKTNIFHLHGNLNTRIAPGLQLELGGVFERQISAISDYRSENAWHNRLMLNFYASKDPVTGLPLFQFPKGGIKKSTDNLVNTHTLRAQLSYNKNFSGDKHSLLLLAGAEQREISRSSRLNTVFGYNTNTLTTEPANLRLIGNRLLYTPGYMDVLIPTDGYIQDQTLSTDYFDESQTNDRFVSVYMNAAYTYEEKYALTGSARIDQSNLFGKDPKFRYTPLWSSGVSWQINREAFMKNAKWVSQLKLRLAAGYNGNIINRGGAYSILSAQQGFLTYTPNPVVGYTLSIPANSSLRWEKTLNLNAGIDFGVFNDRLSGSVDYYIKNGKDIIAQIGSDPTKGFSNLNTNNASIRNKGLDISLLLKAVEGRKFQWHSQVTGSFNNSKVIDVKTQYRGFTNYYRVLDLQNEAGYPMDAFFTIDYAGLNNQGEPMAKGENGESVVLNAYPLVDIPFSAMRFSGVNMPRYSVGFNNQFTYGCFTLNTMLMYYGGHAAIVAPPNPPTYRSRPTKGADNYWKQPGDEKHTETPGFLPWNIVNESYRYGSKFVRKLDFLALRNVTLTYRMKDDLSRKLGLRDTRFMLQVANPVKYTFSGNDVDPETLDFYNGTRNLPIMPSYTISFSTNF